MNIAYIIYYDEEAKKNSGFIDMLKSECRKYDMLLNIFLLRKLILCLKVLLKINSKRFFLL